MGRIASGIDNKLIKVGIKLARSGGLGGFSVRELCAASKVNLGMFHYYFGTKENFDKAVLEAIYNELLQTIQVKVSSQNPARANIENVLKSIHIFIRANRVLLSALAGDVFGGNENIARFISENFTIHISILKEELGRAKKEGFLRDNEISNSIVILVAPVAVPQVLVGLMQRFKNPLPLTVQAIAMHMETDRMAFRRIKMLLNAVFKEQV